MSLPMMGFLLMLTLIGGSGSLVAIPDPPRPGLLPFTLAMSFSGAGVYLLALGSAYLGGIIFGPSTLPSYLFLIGLLIGGIGGAILGFIAGTRRDGRMSHIVQSTDAEERS